jgi:penicillin-binding protein 2
MSSLFGNSGIIIVNERPMGRIRFLQILFILIFALYALRLFNMQIISGEQYRRRSVDIARRITVLPAQRGEIYDRNFNEPVVVNNDTFAVTIVPAEIPEGEIPDLISRVAALLKVPRREIEEKIPPQYYRLYQPLTVASNVSFETVAVLAENLDTLPGLSWQSTPVRNYGEVGSLSHIVGYVGNITRDEFTQLYNRGYQQGDIIGKLGIERQYDDILRGRDGLETRTVDVRGQRISGDLTREPAAMGKNLVLTVDRSVRFWRKRPWETEWGRRW